MEDEKISIRIPKLAVSLLTLIVLFSGLVVFAQSEDVDTSSITFPVAELGNCADKAACKAYCDESENIIKCVNFAETQGLISKEKADHARKFSNILTEGGPGQCKTHKECENFCEDINNLDVCIEFAEKHDIIPERELSEIRMVHKALKEGATLPGGCTNKKDCDNYCENSEHIIECSEFAEKAGFMTKEEVEEAKRIAPLIAAGESPGKCKTEKECKKYCDNLDNLDECVDFAVKAGFMDEEEAEMIKKTGGKGPGECDSEKSCDTFCNAPENHQVCFDFAKEHGLISEEELVKIKDGVGRLKESLNDAPEEVVLCIKETVGPEGITKIENDEFIPGKDIGDKIHECFKAMEPKFKEEMRRNFEHMDPEVRECFKDEIGEHKLEVIEKGDDFELTSELGESMRLCFKKIEPKFKEQMRQGIKESDPTFRECLVAEIGEKQVSIIETGDDFEMTKELGNSMEICYEKMQPIYREEMRRSLKEMEPPVKECLIKEIGQDKFNEMESGADFKMTRELGDSMQKCFEIMQPVYKDQLRENIKEITPEVRNCMINNIGADTFNNIESGGDFELSRELGDSMQECFKIMQKEFIKEMGENLKTSPPEVRECILNRIGKSQFELILSGEEFEMGRDVGDAFGECFKAQEPKYREEIRESVSRADPEVRSCLTESLGSSVVASIEAGEEFEMTRSFGDKMSACFQMMNAKYMAETRDHVMKASTEVRECIKIKVGSEIITDIEMGNEFELDEKLGEAIQDCYEASKPEMDDGERMGEDGIKTDDGIAIIDGSTGEITPTTDPLRSFDPLSKDCIYDIYGSDFFDRMKKGEVEIPSDIHQKIESCIRDKMVQQQGELPPIESIEEPRTETKPPEEIYTETTTETRDESGTGETHTETKDETNQ